MKVKKVLIETKSGRKPDPVFREDELSSFLYSGVMEMVQNPGQICINRIESVLFFQGLGVLVELKEKPHEF